MIKLMILNIFSWYNTAMPYLIDGHNLIPHIPGLSLEALDDEEQLIRLLQEFCRREQKNVEVFFDNAPPAKERSYRSGRVKAHFVRQGRSADAAIVARLHQLGGEARNWTVVSADRMVQAAARERHAQVLDAQAFARLLAQNLSASTQATAQSPQLSPEEVDEWLKLFKQGKPKRD